MHKHDIIDSFFMVLIWLQICVETSEEDKELNDWSHMLKVKQSRIE